MSWQLWCSSSQVHAAVSPSTTTWIMAEMPKQKQMPWKQPSLALQSRQVSLCQHVSKCGQGYRMQVA